MFRINFFLAIFFLFFQSCTITFNNVSTNGKADDVIDEQQDASPTISPDISVPVSAV